MKDKKTRNIKNKTISIKDWGIVGELSSKTIRKKYPDKIPLKIKAIECIEKL